jgi:hypothetical protein
MKKTSADTIKVVLRFKGNETAQASWAFDGNQMETPDQQKYTFDSIMIGCPQAEMYEKTGKDTVQ